MIVNLLIASGATVIGEYSASVAPPRFTARVSNGSYVTPTFEASAQNGVGPYEYLWEYESGDGAQISINSPTSQRTSLNVSFYNNSVFISLKCTVKDTGNGNAEFTAVSSINIQFGDNF